MVADGAREAWWKELVKDRAGGFIGSKMIKGERAAVRRAKASFDERGDRMRTNVRVDERAKEARMNMAGVGVSVPRRADADA